MRTASNKVELSIKEKKELRKLFFQKKDMNCICDKTGITKRVIYRIVNENKWLKKRERYWLFLIKSAYQNGKSLDVICEDTGVSSPQILRRIKQRYGIKTQRFNIANKIITEDIEKNMVSDYKGMMPASTIAKKYGFKTPKTVLDVLDKYKIEKREPKIITYYNTDYFKKVDSNDKAYILGLLLTDGYVLKDYVGFGIQLQEQDGYILERIAKRMGDSASVIFINCENKRKKTKVNAQDMKRLTVHNREIAEDLKKLSVVKNKTFILRCPKINKKYLPSFFRGLWDGDGTVGIAKTGNIWCKLVSASKLFLEDLQSLELPFEFVLKKHQNIYKLRLVGGNKKTVKFLKWIYKDKEDLYLERKYAKVQNKIN